MEGLSKISVVLPSLNPDDKLLTVIQGLITYGFEDILLVNDGSKAENRHYFEAAAARPASSLLNFVLNKHLVFHRSGGAGKALLRLCRSHCPAANRSDPRHLSASAHWGNADPAAVRDLCRRHADPVPCQFYGAATLGFARDEATSDFHEVPS